MITKFLELFPYGNIPIISTLIGIIFANIPYLYSIIMIGKYGQTLGKMAMKVKVVDYETEEKIGYYQSFLRECIPFIMVNASIILFYIIIPDPVPANYDLSLFDKIILFIPLGMLSMWSLLEIITMLFDDKFRALHDKVADTVVVRVINQSTN